MGSEYKKTAKDLAFERERTRLHSRIQQLQEEIRIQEGIISKKDALIAEHQQISLPFQAGRDCNISGITSKDHAETAG